MRSSEWRWCAYEECHHLRGIDARLKARLLAMLRAAGARGGGRISDVFTKGCERQGAYDLLEGGRVSAEALVESFGIACVERSEREERVFVPIDGSSLQVVDRKKKTDLGLVGTYTNDARGLQTVTALAVTTSGVPIGICAQRYWARSTKKRKKTRSGSKYRPVEERETHHYVEAIRDVLHRYEGSSTTPWIVIDRGGDATVILDELVRQGASFTVRASWNRRVSHGQSKHLRPLLEKQRTQLRYSVNVAEGPKRRARVAKVSVRTATVQLDVSHDWKAKRKNPTVNVVWVREERAPAGEKPLDWMLYTSAPISTAEDILLVIRSYTMRWRIEDFHKTWKSGHCRVEETMLRSAHAVKTWATLLATVAARIERLRHLARSEPDSPASIELSDAEIEALKLLKEDQKKKTEVIAEGMPTIGLAVRWLADLGGYTGKSSGGPPGATTIGRGLEDLALATRVLGLAQKRGKKR